jgi:hypothetical protein
MNRIICLVFGIVLWCNAAVIAAEQRQFRAARSVHLSYQSPECVAFYVEMVVKRSSTGRYFMACGWRDGYFGIQELLNGRKVAIFSVWDPTAGDDPNVVNPQDRVECLYEGDGVRVKRFGGEGTGGQCMMDFNWKIGETNRFVVIAEVQGEKTAYSGYLWLNEKKEWKKLVTFRTRTGGRALRGLYSFVEDFRRDGKSVSEVREAEYFSVFSRLPNGEWNLLNRARFSASNASWESKENIDAGVNGNKFYLATGGSIKQGRKLGEVIEIKGNGWKLPGDIPIDVKN